MTDLASFLEELEREVKQQLRSQRVGYLLGAGSSYLGGKGYPLTAALWERIANDIPERERAQIQAKLAEGADGIEPALDALDDGGATETPHRLEVTRAIAALFRTLTPPLNTHMAFVQRLGGRSDRQVPVYSLNYDPLVEHAADRARVRLTDGFLGTENAFFEGSSFGETPYFPRGTHKGRQLDPAPRPIQILKLHGSLGWYEDKDKIARRCAYTASPPEGTRLLMVPPQRRKAAETTHPPYSALWSRFRGGLSHDERPLNRLVSIGYGFRDHHVNEIIEPALSRSDFTLLIFAMDLLDSVWDYWSPKSAAIVVTKNRCSLFGRTGEGHKDLWDFERLAQEV
jgi:hypothetical protein